MDRESRRPNHKARGIADPGLVDELRAKVTPEQRVLLGRLWNPSEPFGWTPAKLLFHQLPTSASREALEALGGSAVTETQGLHDESYVLRLLGAFLGDRGAEREELLARYLAYLAQRYDSDPRITEISSTDVARDLNLSEAELSDLPYLVNMALPSFCSGSSRSQNGWTLGVPRDIHDLAEVRDWPRYVRERALRDYDPKLPVRASTRAEYVNRRQLVAKRRRRKEAEASLPTPATRGNRRRSPAPGLNWLMPLVVERRLLLREFKPLLRNAFGSQPGTGCWIRRRCSRLRAANNNLRSTTHAFRADGGPRLAVSHLQARQPVASR